MRGWWGGEGVAGRAGSWRVVCRLVLIVAVVRVWVCVIGDDSPGESSNVKQFKRPHCVVRLSYAEFSGRLFCLANSISGRFGMS